MPGSRSVGFLEKDRGYAMTNRIEYDYEDGIPTSRIAGIRDGVGLHADSVEELKEAVDDYVETCNKIGNL